MKQDQYKHLRHNPLKDFSKVLAILVIGSVVCLMGLNILTSALLEQIPMDVEMKLFNKKSHSFWASKNEHQLPELNEVLQALLEVEEKKTYPFEIFLQCSLTPNAFALPGGKIIITSGLLKTLKSENGLAFVIGHELGHFHHRHHLKGFGKGLILATLLSSFGMGESAGALSGLVAMGSDFVSLSFSRKKEKDSDLYGLKLLRRAYGSTNGASEFFTEMAKKKKGELDWLSTHPMSEKRVKRIESARNPDPYLKLSPISKKITSHCSDF